MRSLLGTRGKTQERVYHSIKEEGKLLRALCQKSAVFRPFQPLFPHPHSAHAFSPVSPFRGHSRLDRPTPSGVRSCHVWSGFDALWLFYSETLRQSLGNKGGDGEKGGNVGFTHLLELKILLKIEERLPVVSWFAAPNSFFKLVKLAKAQLLAVLRFRR